jgi:glycosyltransferase involved in cell wall biosynthesis
LTVELPGDDSIAAIIPLFNGAKFIERSLRSVLAQTRPADEIIIVDDGSTDDGLDVARRVLNGHNSAQLLVQTNAGQSSARNLAVSKAKSSRLAFLDQDDWWYPEHLERLERPFNLHHSRPLGWVYSDLDEYDLSGRMVVHRMLTTMETEHPKRTITACLGHDMYILPSAALIDRAAFDAVGGFDPRLSGYEDDDLFLRMFLAGYYNVFIPRALSAWCIHGGSASYSPRMARSAIVYAQKLIEEFPDDRDRHRYYRRDLIAPRFLRNAAAFLMRAAATGKATDVEFALRGIDLCRRYLPTRYRLPLAMVRPFLGNRFIARILGRAAVALSGR